MFDKTGKSCVKKCEPVFLWHTNAWSDFGVADVQ